MSEQIIQLATETLKTHPRNSEFFDDISGEEYERFKQSISDDGIITPLLIAPDMTIISGHQRHKACIDLGIKMLPVVIREELIDEDTKVRQLIAANFGRIQKGDGAKYRKAVDEYVKLNGNGHGGSRRTNGDLNLSQSEIAKQLGISERELQKLLQLERSLTSEIKSLLDTKKITKTTALSICSNLTKEEQAEVVKELSAGSENVELNALLEEKKKVLAENAKLKEENKSHASRESEYQQEIEQLKNQEPVMTETIKEVEVVPDDYKTLKKRVKELENELLDAKIEVKRGQQVKDYNFELFETISNNYKSYTETYETIDYKYKEMSGEELNKFLAVVDDVEESLNNIKKTIGGIINIKQGA